MSGPGFPVDDSELRRWMGDVEPAWNSLAFESFNALRHEPSATNRALSLASDLSLDELNASAVARNALLLVRRASVGSGLKLTATGNLARSVVAEMIDLFDWPDFDKAEEFRFHKVVNEPDFLPVFFVRHLVEVAKLVRQHRGLLKATRLGRELAEEPRVKALLAILFHVTFWHCDLSYLCRDLHGSWPQRDVGVILWSLSVGADDWRSPEMLTRLCTIPINEVVEAAWDSGSMAMDARILRPLHWFGLLEHRREAIPGDRFGRRHFYRKSPFFDRLLRFDVQVERTSAVLN
jgi:hypothetical protein